MIIVSSAIVGLLVLVAIVMGIRFWNKSHQKGLKADEVQVVKTEIVDAPDFEPQFVLEADDSKNIFGRPSASAMIMDIEKSEGQGKKKRKLVKKIVKRKRPGS